MDDPDLWSYAIRLYGAPGVGEACLALQDACRVDVPLLLASAWAARHGRAVGPAEAARLDAAVSAWRTEVVQPLRTVRRRLKTGPSPAPDAATDRLRTQIKAAELEAERIELSVLEREAAALQRDETVNPHRLRNNLVAVLAHATGSGPDGAATAHMETIVAAARAL